MDNQNERRNPLSFHSAGGDGTNAMLQDSEARNHSSMGWPDACPSAMSRRLPKPRKCCVITLILMVLTVIGFELGLFIAKKIIHSKVLEATVSLQGITLVMSAANRPATYNCKVFIPKSVLDVPLLTFSATVDPTTVSVYTIGDAVEIPGHAQRSIMTKLGEVNMPTVRASSGNDLALDLSGTFAVTNGKAFASTVKSAIVLPKLQVALKASASMSARVWGFIPVWLNGVDIDYQMEVPAMDNFSQENPRLVDIITARGHAGSGLYGSMDAECSAEVLNPSPATVIVEDTVEFHVEYDWLGTSFMLGTLTASNLTVKPGKNIVQGAVNIQQTDSNLDAIKEVATAYLGGIQEGFEPSGKHPLTVRLKDFGQPSAGSEMVREAMNGLDLNLKFQPKAMRFVSEITCDVTFASIADLSPYIIRLHVKVHNPLPQTVFLKHAKVTAREGNLSGPALYFFDHPLEGGVKIPGKSATFVTVPLGASDIIYPGMMNIVEALRKATTQKYLDVGVDAVFGLMVEDGFKQEINYQNNRLVGTICYHLFEWNKKICGDDAAVGFATEANITKTGSEIALALV